jgi:dTDP-4-dehydrorhamnose 3,5-epimerase
MKVLPTTLPGVILLELDSFSDERGRFMETFQSQRYRDLHIGTGLEFLQDNLSSSTRGTLRGLHYQLRTPQGKLVHVTRGEIFDVAVDIRQGSPMFGYWFGTLLSAENRRQLWIPPGFAHGFYVTSESADVVYKVTAAYRPDDQHSIRWDDDDLEIDWPLGNTAPLLSAADAAASAFKTAALPTCGQ